MDPSGLDSGKPPNSVPHGAGGLLDSVVRYASDPIFLLDAEGVIRYVNPAVERMLGYGPEELVGTRVFDLGHPEDVEPGSGSFQGWLVGPGISPPRLFRVRRKDGSWRQAEVSLNNLLEDPAVGGVVMTCRDATDRVEAEEVLRESEARFRSVVHNSTEIVTIVDLNGTVRYASPAWDWVLGYDPEELIGTNVLEHVHPDDLSHVLDLTEKAVAEGGVVRNVAEYRFKHRDGSWRHVESRGTYLLDDPMVSGVVVHTRDVTERKEAEEALKESERRYATLLSNEPAMVYRCPNEPRWPMEFVSDYALELTGYLPEELLFYGDLIVEKDRRRVWQEVQAALNDRRRFRLRYTISRKDNAVRHVEEYGQGIYGEDGRIEAIEGLVYDVTERVRAEEQLRAAEERYRTVVEQIPLVTYVDRATGSNDPLYTSPQIEDLLGYTPEEWLESQMWPKRLYPEDRERVLAADERFESGEEESFGEEYRLLAKDDSVVWVREEAVLLRDEAGQPLFWQGVIVDVTERKETEEALKQSEGRFRSLVQNGSEVILIMGDDGTVRYVSPALERVLGFRPEDVLGRDSFEVVHPDDVATVRAVVGDAVQSPGTSFHVEMRLRHADGSWRYMESRCNSLLDDPAVGGVVFNSRDVTKRKLTEQALVESERRFRRSFEDAAVGMALVGTDGRWLRVNRALCEIVGYTEGELLTRTLQDITHPDDLEADLEQIRRFLAGEIRTYQVERRYLHKEGRVVWVLLGLSLVHDEEGDPLYFIIQVQDVSGRKRMEGQLERLALHDALTGLPNRKLFVDRLGQALERTRRSGGRKVAVLFMDLDGFKVVNDSLGHETGDLLLVVLAERLRRCLRPEDTLARFGGDEFVILVENVENPGDAIRVARRVTEELRRPFVLEDKSLFVSASVGIGLGDALGKSREDLLRDADTAMYRAKEEHTSYKVFDPSMYERVVGRLELENDLRQAVEAEEFVIHYQPIIDLETEEIWGVEALVRWNHPKRGLLEPSDFIPLSEESGMVISVGEKVLEAACRQAQLWHQEPRLPPLVVSVNLSAVQLRRSDLARTVRETLHKTGLDPRRLNLDVTETAYIRALDDRTATLDRLKNLGVSISIDDFGVGYSSLAYLKRLPANILKMDRSFVRGVGEDLEDTAIVRMVIDLAHTLGMRVVAEGVEGWAQAALLREMGCDLAQGFHFFKPLPPEEIHKVVSVG